MGNLLNIKIFWVNFMFNKKSIELYKLGLALILLKIILTVHVLYSTTVLYYYYYYLQV